MSNRTGKHTTAIGNMRHLAARHNVAFRILYDLGRRQRRRLGGDCDGIHGVALTPADLIHDVEARSQSSQLRR
jgi:hypothetical protein